MKTSNLGSRPKVQLTIVLVLASIFFSVVQARADAVTVTFSDANEPPTMTVTGITSALKITLLFGCAPQFNGEGCGVNIASTTGAVIDDSTFPNVLVLESAGSTAVSDQVQTDESTSEGEALIGFVSYPAPNTAQPCFYAGIFTCTTMVEDGSFQTAGTIHWSDGSTVTIQFQSDLDTPVATPEPSSLALLGIGGLALAGLKLKRAIA